MLTFAENNVSLSSNTTDTTKLPFQRFSLKLIAHCPAGGAAFKNLSIELLLAENVDAYWNYEG